MRIIVPCPEVDIPQFLVVVLAAVAEGGGIVAWAVAGIVDAAAKGVVGTGFGGEGQPPKGEEIPRAAAEYCYEKPCKSTNIGDNRLTSLIIFPKISDSLSQQSV